jgi:hypothetical protein
LHVVECNHRWHPPIGLAFLDPLNTPQALIGIVVQRSIGAAEPIFPRRATHINCQDIFEDLGGVFRAWLNFEHLIGTQNYVARCEVKLPTSLQQNDDFLMFMAMSPSGRTLRDLEPRHAHLLSLRNRSPIQFGDRVRLHRIPVIYMHRFDLLISFRRQSAPLATNSADGCESFCGVPSGMIRTGSRKAISSRNRAPTFSMG